MRRQCKACPWRVDVVPERDIPGGYCEAKHRALEKTISDGSFRGGNIQAMACHESRVGAEFVCVGWLANQLGPGNNIALRLQSLSGRYPAFELVGAQHARFEDTLPKKTRGER